MPIVAIMSLAVAIVPSVSASRVRLDIDSVMLKVNCASNLLIFWAFRLRFTLPYLRKIL